MAHNASLEWLNANLSKAYPFADTTGGHADALPSEFLVNACILYDCSALGPAVNISVAYISGVTCTERGVTLSLECIDSTGLKHAFEDLALVSFGAAYNATVTFMAQSEAGLVISGSFTVGRALSMRNYPLSKSLGPSSGLLSPGTIHDISGLYVTAIRVGDTLLSGEVVLAPGPGVEIELAGGTIMLTNTKYSVPGDNLEITTDSELLDAAINTYGRPIRSINGVTPTVAGGDISFVSVTLDGKTITADGAAVSVDGNAASRREMEDYITISSAGVGTISLELIKDPCMEDSTVDGLGSQIKQLNERCAKINSAQVGLDNAVNAVATQLTRVG